MVWCRQQVGGAARSVLLCRQVLPAGLWVWSRGPLHCHVPGQFVQLLLTWCAWPCGGTFPGSVLWGLWELLTGDLLSAWI